MKTKFISVFLFIFPLITSSQWEPDVQLTNEPAGSYTSENNAWCIAANGNILHVVWTDLRDGDYEIYYKRSTDGGVSWGTDIRLMNSSGISSHPSVAVSGSVVHVVWADRRDGNPEIYYKRSIDGGTSWGADERLTNNSAFSYYPSVSVSGTLVNIVWYDERDGSEIYYKRSTDGGASWGGDTRLSNHTGQSTHPSSAVSGSVVHVVWHDRRDGDSKIYYKRSADGGINWGPETPLMNTASNSRFASVSVSGSAVHVVWWDFRDGNREIYYKQSSDGGISWGGDTRLTNNTPVSHFPSVAVSGSVVHVVWCDQRDADDEIYYKRSTDGGVSWGTDTRLTNSSGQSTDPSIAASGSIVHVVWNDYRDGNYDIYYKRDPTGNPVSTGIIPIGNIIPDSYTLFQNYPNPFNPSTNIKFAIPRSGFVKLAVFDMLGREIETLVNENLSPGIYNVNLNVSKFPSGIYYYRIETADFTETRKMVLVK